MQTKLSSLPPSTPFVLIPLGKNRYAIIDDDDWDYLSAFHWSLRRSHSNWYAVRKTHIGRQTQTIFMHREIMQPRPNEDTHHINHDTLDNRRSNLVNLHPSAHHRLHAQARITKKTLDTACNPG